MLAAFSADPMKPVWTWRESFLGLEKLFLYTPPGKHKWQFVIFSSADLYPL